MTHCQRNSTSSGFLFAALLVCAVGGAGVLFDRKLSPPTPARQSATQLARQFAVHGWSPEVERIASWVITSKDHAGHPFLIIDQARSRLFAFTGQGSLVASTPVVRSVAWADPPAPAGRFVADGWRSARVGEMVWDSAGRALSLRALATSRSPRRLASAGQPDSATREDDNERRASSFQVAGDFYRLHLRALRHQASVAYVLPDTLPMRRRIASYAAWAPSNPRSIS